MTAPFNKFNQFVQDIGTKVHNLASDSLKLLLTNTAPVATNAVKGDLVDITAHNGYGAGGPVLTTTSYTQTAGTASLILADKVITASGGTIGPFRYPTLYNDTPTSPAKPLIGWWDYGSAITLNDGETFTQDFDNTLGALEIA